MSPVFSIRALVVEGQLAGVRAGDDRDSIRARLGLPDGQRVDALDDLKVWRYGSFEIFFNGDVADTLALDSLGDLEAGPGRELEAWVLGGPGAPDRDEVVDRLVAEQVPFVAGRDRQNRRVLQVRGGARLLFERDEDTGIESWRAIKVFDPAYAPGFTPDLAPPTGPTLDRFLLVRRISAYTAAHVLLGVFSTASLADAARAAYLERYAADPASDPWREQAYKDDGLVEDDLVVTCLSGPAEAVEVFVVSDDSEGFGQIIRTFDSLHDSEVAADARIAVLDDVESMFPHYALRQRARLDVLLSNAEEAQPGFYDDSEPKSPKSPSGSERTRPLDGAPVVRPRPMHIASPTVNASSADREGFTVELAAKPRSGPQCRLRASSSPAPPICCIQCSHSHERSAQ
ncbi:hypothetical protein SAMN02745121_01324 [Nannocystis exedens]|uniref:Uncharacterized protein n=1 Tax=Nannocystis exedens TaxID=54 RepID=A0A1I1UV07_9BACT|nr:hypothetical protein [Nannocystis exedens]PCC72115.1 hypothetical protein NAEX_05194 [Nannocystis exedens]SFD74652.1 hypothetical protein SAMN02745121_01324 [Nannocystis exedens]